MTLDPHRKDFSLSRILLATDLTANSDAAIDYAKVLARTFHSLVLIVHILDNVLLTAPATTMSPPEMLQIRNTKRKNLLRVKSKLSGAGIQTRVILYEGHPVSSILVMLARHRKADLLVVAANHDLTKAELTAQTLLEDVLPASQCPLFVVGVRANEYGLPAGLASILYVETGLDDVSVLASSYSQAFAEKAGAVLYTLQLGLEWPLSEGVGETASTTNREAALQNVVDVIEAHNADILICSLSQKKNLVQQEQLHLIKDLIRRIRFPVLILST
jgi:nucleotide-binding universal stress UspA family protein